jgi:CubicO group peptidase (beta-lactamase class C family)
MKRNGLAAVALGVLALTGGGTRIEPADWMAQLMRDAVVPGVALGVIEGRHERQFSFGLKNSVTRDPVTKETVFEAASLSKPVFAYAVLRLVDSGRLDLDKPLSDYLQGDYIEKDERVRRITARLVLSHRTGFPNWRPRGKQLTIGFEPGERFSYSGEGYVYLQKVVEHLMGRPLNIVMQRLVFDEIGMPSSSYVWRDDYARLSATGHGIGGSPVEKNQPKEANAAASLHTTASDYTRFVLAVLEGKGLKASSAAEILTPHVWVDEGCTNCIGRKPVKTSTSLAWGLGWGIERTAEGDSFWHWGDNGSFKCFVVVRRRKQRRGLVMFTNSSNGLSIVRQVVERTIGGSDPAFDWIHYDQYDSPTRKFMAAVLKDGTERAIAAYRAADPSLAKLDEGLVNGFGYQLIEQHRVSDAVEVFKLNVAAFPNSSNVYDSLGEAYALAGDRQAAISNYERSLQLNPNNTEGAEKLKTLKEGGRVHP